MTISRQDAAKVRAALNTVAANASLEELRTGEESAYKAAGANDADLRSPDGCRRKLLVFLPAPEKEVYAFFLLLRME